MSEYIEKIAQVADSLDRKGMTKQANLLDSVLGAVATVRKVTAQYEGGLGYWVQNERCWGNCYRKKRVDNPTKAAQEVWTDCLAEYRDAIDGDDKKWNKYAESSDYRITTADREFATKIASQVSAGEHVGFVVTAEIEERKDAANGMLMVCADAVSKLSSKLNDPSDASRLAEVSEALLKEAQSNWNPMNWRKNYRKYQDRPDANLEAVQGIAMRADQLIHQQVQRMPNLFSPTMGKIRQTVMTQINSELQRMVDKMPPAAKPQAQQWVRADFPKYFGERMRDLNPKKDDQNTGGSPSTSNPSNSSSNPFASSRPTPNTMPSPSPAPSAPPASPVTPAPAASNASQQFVEGYFSRLTGDAANDSQVIIDMAKDFLRSMKGKAVSPTKQPTPTPTPTPAVTPPAPTPTPSSPVPVKTP